MTFAPEKKRNVCVAPGDAQREEAREAVSNWKGGTMSFDGVQFVRITKRMAAAAGYLELGLADHALERLQGLGELGPLEAEVELLRGEALRSQHRYAEAAASFKNAAKKAPTPQNRTAWLALSMCYRQAGDTDRAIQSLAHARGAQPRKIRPKNSN